MSTNKTFLAFASLLVATCLATSAVASPPLLASETAVAATDGVEIPTQLVNDPIPNDANGPCSHCRVFPLKSTTSAPTVATFELYFADDGEDLYADIEVQVLLSSNEYRTVTLHEVELVDRTTDLHVLGSGSGWDWTDVTHAWVEVIPLS